MLSRIYFRINFGKNIGMGHWVRSLAVSSYLPTDIPVYFVLNDLEKIDDVQALDKNRFLEQTDCDESWIQRIKKEDIVLVDSYNFPLVHRQSIKRSGATLVCIDDEKLNHEMADVIVNQSELITRNTYPDVSPENIYSGFQFSLLRKEFVEIAQHEIRRNKKKILIQVGGSDPLGISFLLLEALEKIEISVSISVVLGKLVDGQLKKKIVERKSKHSIHILYDLSSQEMAQTMKEHSHVIAPASSTMIEAIACQCRLMSFYFAENQAGFHRFLIENEFACDLGNLENGLSQELFVQQFDTFYKKNNPHEYQALRLKISQSGVHWRSLFSKLVNHA